MDYESKSHLSKYFVPLCLGLILIVFVSANASVLQFSGATPAHHFKVTARVPALPPPGTPVMFLSCNLTPSRFIKMLHLLITPHYHSCSLHNNTGVQVLPALFNIRVLH